MTRRRLLVEVIEPKVQCDDDISTIKNQIIKCAKGAKVSREKFESPSFGEAESFILGKILKPQRHKHLSVLRHGTISFLITCSRSISHQLVRHSAGVDFTQSSTRYIKQTKDNKVKLVRPPHEQSIFGSRFEISFEQDTIKVSYGLEFEKSFLIIHFTELYRAPWFIQDAVAINNYANRIEEEFGHCDIPQESARYSLPHSIATYLYCTFNFQALRYVIDLRGQPNVSPEFRFIASQLYNFVNEISPVLTKDIDEPKIEDFYLRSPTWR